MHNAIYCHCTWNLLHSISRTAASSALNATQRQSRYCHATHWRTFGGSVAAPLQPVLAIPSCRGTHNLLRIIRSTQSQWQHKLTISASTMLTTTAHNHALSAHKHHLGSLSHSANHYRFHTKVWKKHDHPFTYWKATTFSTLHYVSPIMFSRIVPQTAIITTSHASDNTNQS